MKMKCKVLYVIVAAGFFLPAWVPGYAGEKTHKTTIENITVTANKTEENAQKIPMSITALDEFDIQDRSITQTSDLFDRVPNMYLTRTGPLGATDNIASVRGITSFMTGGSVYGFFVDDVFYPSADINLMDVARIEVLRGPQGTLYGKNTEAGVINVITKKPENAWAGNISLSYGNYNTVDTTLAGGGALVKDKLFVRMAGKFNASDGYFTNTVDNDDNVNEGKTYDGRISLFYQPSDRLTADLKVNLQKYNTNYAEFTSYDKVMDGNFDISVNDPGDVDKDFKNASLKIAYDMDDIRLTSITGLVSSDRKNRNDVDFTPRDDYRLNTKTDRQSYTQEFRLNSTNRSQLKWTVGTYLFNTTDDSGIIYDVPAYGVSSEQYGDMDSKGAAVYGQADYTMGDLIITAGLRYEYERKNYDYLWKNGDQIGYTPCAGSSEKNFEALLPKFALTYELTENFRPYASVAKGFKSGGFNLSSDPGASYDSEYTWNYELGFKSELAHNRIQLNAALFYISWEDLQVEQPSYPDYVIDNAAEATSKGVEVELRVRPVPGIDLYGSLGYVDATFDEYTSGAADYSGKNIPNSPSHTYSIGSTCRFLDHWMVNAELNGAGTIYYTADNNKSQGSYQVVNVKAGYETDRFDLYLWARNLFDEAYATRAFQMGSDWWARNGDPLTLGLTFRYRF
jgi:iron complex outermembrane receptor protein